MPISLIPSIDVCLDRNHERVLLIHKAHTVDSDGMYRGNLPFAVEEEFSVDEFERVAVSKIRESFASFPSRKGIPDSEVGSFTKKKWLSILREHRIVGISMQDFWHFGPFYHTRAARSRGEDYLSWDPSLPDRSFYRLLWMALGRAELKKRRPNQTLQPTALLGRG